MRLPRKLTELRIDLSSKGGTALRVAINCALANREILGHYARRIFLYFFPSRDLRLLFDVSHNTCNVETHAVEGKQRELFVHRKGATRAFGPGHPNLPEALRHVGQTGAYLRQHGHWLVHSGRRGDG